ncbi:LytR/AlgR family response regulator transcription factor [Spongiimicrobium salis]|uniref:LytR/AlgR family response regulator transcription factor n=1 Tax=Spongiimicrobium salis TaxID=1667022 RepID=UPI00374CBBAF
MRIEGRAFWNTPITVFETKKQKWGIILSVTLFIPVFLLVFQPFGVNNYDPTHKIRWDFLWASVGFGLIGGFTLCLSEFLIAPYLFRKKTRGTLLLNTLLTIVLGATTIYIYYNILGHFHDWAWSSYLGFIRDVGLMSSIPIGAAFLFFLYRNTKDTYEDLLRKSESGISKKRMIVLMSDNGKESISFPLHELRYMEAQDNYVAVFYMMNGHLQKQLLRTTMKTLASKLEAEAVVRCHRSYMVHLDAVIKAKGEGHQQKLYLSNISSPIPVSRSYNPLVKQMMAIRHK